MLVLKDIYKDYKTGDTVVQAIKGLDIAFRDKEFVSILGPSGCGKTTLLNIIGGLDHYTSGDMLVNGKTTKEYADRDWDSYRNAKIGFVFQSYNLISHLSVLDNVAMALALSGVSVKERKERASAALAKVGLELQLHKRPNQLSGGQMQRVAIARALVNEPKILLADEPTGALDTETSVQIMELIKSISSEMLVIMVTHNPDLAESYSSRLIRMVDGKIESDSSPCDPADVAAEIALSEKLDAEIIAANNGKKAKRVKRDKSLPKVSMSFLSAVKSSFKNLTSKKGRTIMTAIAGSIGIIGIALVLAVSSGMTGFITAMQADTLSGMPITISKEYFDYNAMMSGMGTVPKDELPEFPSDGVVKPYEPSNNYLVKNKITQEYIEYVSKLDKTLYNSISYSSAVEKNGVAMGVGGVVNKLVTGGAFAEIPNSEEFIKSQYDVLGDTKYPTKANEAVIIIDSRNRVQKSVLDNLGMDMTNYNINDFIGKSFKIVHNDDFYVKKESGAYVESNDFDVMYASEKSIKVQIVGVLRIKESAAAEMLSTGIGYTTHLTDAILDSAAESNIVLAQKATPEINIKTGKPFNPLNTQETYGTVMQAIGGDRMPIGISIYPVSFETKDAIKVYLDSYNVDKAKEDKVLYTDMAETISKTMTSMINTMTIALSAFAGISLVVSSIMIGIITYVSVVERTKEIGIMRSLGARKRDISRIFNAETLLIGLVSGLIGVIIAAILSLPLTALITKMIGMTFKVGLPILSALILVIISMGLTFIAGLIPSRFAAKKDPVVALRTE